MTSGTCVMPGDLYTPVIVLPAPTNERRRFLVAIRLITWSVVGVPVLIAIARQPELLGRRFVLGWLVAYAAFLICDLFAAPPWTSVPRPLRTRILLGVQTLAALAANALIPMPFAGVSLGGILLVIIAGHLPYVLALPPALVWVVSQSVALLLVYRYLADWPWAICAGAAGAYFAFQLFSVFLSHTASSEARARSELAEAHGRLLEAQRQLAATATIAERARLWRELHDIMGHHLAAMSLNLEAAANLSDGRARELIRQCRGLSRVMLADIRSVLSESDAEPLALDLRAELERLGHDLAGVDVASEVAGPLPGLSAAQTNALLRIAQECVTNATRHGGARNIRLRLEAAPGVVRLNIRDDGRGCDAGEIERSAGVGIRNMRQRVEELGGGLSIDAAAGKGLSVTATLPIASDAGAAVAAAPEIGA